ncbi:hypothetical protein SAMN05216215_10753 [Saccharopolyspora shandongensis]|uniref:Uncharacterized protein n=1 Tax=Saccharopolyspora shandongensis TaxID=418495 RepID=A0A1H3T3W4_9PSEU|nr:hypothetical protein SAMN05216215_10753 [Saccharopolyspora shandongensis]
MNRYRKRSWGDVFLVALAWIMTVAMLLYGCLLVFAGNPGMLAIAILLSLITLFMSAIWSVTRPPRPLVMHFGLLLANGLLAVLAGDSVLAIASPEASTFHRLLGFVAIAVPIFAPALVWRDFPMLDSQAPERCRPASDSSAESGEA